MAGGFWATIDKREATMGSFDNSCCLSHIGISPGTECVLFLMERGESTIRTTPVIGVYDDYGCYRFDDANMKRLESWATCLKDDIVENPIRRPPANAEELVERLFDEQFTVSFDQYLDAKCHSSSDILQWREEQAAKKEGREPDHRTFREALNQHCGLLMYLFDLEHYAGMYELTGCYRGMLKPLTEEQAAAPPTSSYPTLADTEALVECLNSFSYRGQKWQGVVVPGRSSYNASALLVPRYDSTHTWSRRSPDMGYTRLSLVAIRRDVWEMTWRMFDARPECHWYNKRERTVETLRATIEAALVDVSLSPTVRKLRVDVDVKQAIGGLGGLSRLDEHLLLSDWKTDDELLELCLGTTKVLSMTRWLGVELHPVGSHGVQCTKEAGPIQADWFSTLAAIASTHSYRHEDEEE